MYAKKISTAIAYIAVFGKIIATIITFGSWIIDYLAINLHGPGYGFVIIWHIASSVIIYPITLLLLRFTTRRYRTVLWLIALGIVMDIGFIILDQSVAYSRSW